MLFRSTLCSFSFGSDGGGPAAGLIMDRTGALYGTGAVGGAFNWGVVFKLTPPKPGQSAWTEQTLWTFTNGNDGTAPVAGLIMDRTGALYGTTQFGGASAPICQFVSGNGNGTVFKLTPPKDGKTAWRPRSGPFPGATTVAALWPRSSPTNGGHFMERRMGSPPEARTPCRSAGRRRPSWPPRPTTISPVPHRRWLRSRGWSGAAWSLPMLTVSPIPTAVCFDATKTRFELAFNAFERARMMVILSNCTEALFWQSDVNVSVNRVRLGVEARRPPPFPDLGLGAVVA